MKLYLGSYGLPRHAQSAFVDLIGGTDKKLTLIFNAKDHKPPEKRNESVLFTNLPEAGLGYDQTDLRDYLGNPDGLRDRLAAYDAVWVGGGNTYYLRDILRQSGFDKIIRPLMENGLVYAGTSAGAIVAGPTIEGYEEVDDPALAGTYIPEGMSLVDFCPLPHFGNETYAASLERAQSLLTGKHHKVIPIRDDQALIVRGGQIEEINPAA